MGRGRRDTMGAAFGKVRTPCIIEDDAPSQIENLAAAVSLKHSYRLH